MVYAMNDEDKRRQILLWLQGYIELDNVGLSKVQYLKGDGDKEARKLLADAIRTRMPMRQSMLDAFANLIDPTPESVSGEERILVFKFRSRGKRRNNLRTSNIYFFMEELVVRGDKVESAVAAAMEQFKLSRAEVYKIWSTHKKIDEAFLTDIQAVKNETLP